jgi:hypothetical protein
MRFADNFNPEWGYLAPAPGFMRTARITLVAAAVGAFAGGAVVFSLIEPPAAEDASVAARTLAQPLDTMSPVGTAQPAQAQAPTPSSPSSAQVNAVVENPASAESTTATAQSPANSEAVADAPPPGDAATASTSDETATASKKHRSSEHGGQNGQQVQNTKRGPLDLLRSFAARATSWSSPARSDY